MNESEVWSPSKDIIKSQVAEAPKLTLTDCELVKNLIKAPEDGTGTIGSLLGKAKLLQDEMLAYMQRSQTSRIAELESNIVEASEQGRIAEQELAAANAGVMNARVGEANRENAYNAAMLALNTAKGSPLPRFYTNADVKAKDEAIARAQEAVEAALADMSANPLAIPQAIERQKNAQRKVMALAARVDEYRRELTALGGAKAQTTGYLQSATGLAS